MAVTNHLFLAKGLQWLNIVVTEMDSILDDVSVVTGSMPKSEEFLKAA